MSIEIILASLDNVKQTGTTKWSARCPAHDDGSNSLSLDLTTEGVTLINCFAGCKGSEIMNAIGLPMRALYPPDTNTGSTASFLAPSVTTLRACQEIIASVVLMRTALAMKMNGEIDESKLREILNQGLSSLVDAEEKLNNIFANRKSKIQ